MSTETTPEEWLGVLINGRLFDLSEYERDAQHALTAAGFRIGFATELIPKKRKPHGDNRRHSD